MKIKHLIAIIVAAGITAFIAAGYIRHTRHKEDMPEIRGTYTVKRGRVIATVSGNGEIKPYTSVEVKSNIGGQIIDIFVDEGDVVHAGQLIAIIDSSDASNQLDQSSAELNAAEARAAQAKKELLLWSKQNPLTIEQAQTNYEMANNDYKKTLSVLIPQKKAAIKAAYDQAQADYTQANSNLDRNRSLYSKGFISKSQLELASEYYDVAAAQLDSAREKLLTLDDECSYDLKSAEQRMNQAEKNLLIAKSNLDREDILKQSVIQAESSTESLKSTRRNIQIQIGYSRIVAPSDGVVVKKYVEKGSIITAGKASYSGMGSGVVIVEIADTSRMLAEVDVDESDISMIKLGQQAIVEADAFPGRRFKGIVNKIAPKAFNDQNVTTIPVSVEIKDNVTGFKPGMNANCDFITSRVDGVTIVPNNVFNERADGMYVVLLKNGEMIPERVTTGISGSKYTQITSGVNEGDIIAGHRVPIDKLLKGGKKHRFLKRKNRLMGGI